MSYKHEFHEAFYDYLARHPDHSFQLFDVGRSV